MYDTQEREVLGHIHSSSLFSAHHAGVNEDGNVECERNDKIMAITNDNKEFVKGFMDKWQGLGHQKVIILLISLEFSNLIDFYL